MGRGIYFWKSLQRAVLSVLRVLRTPPYVASKVMSTPPPPSADPQDSFSPKARTRLPQDSAPGTPPGSGQGGAVPQLRGRAASQWRVWASRRSGRAPRASRALQGANRPPGAAGGRGLAATGYQWLLAPKCRSQGPGRAQARRPCPFSHRGQNSARAGRRTPKPAGE